MRIDRRLLTLAFGGLSWRTFALIALLIAVSLTAWFQSFRVIEREPRAQRVALQLVAVVKLTRTALLYSDPDLRRALLLALGDSPSEQIDELLASPLVELDAAPPFYRLRQQDDVLARLRAWRPGDEIRLHTRVFSFLLQRLRQRPDQADEQGCLAHLDALFLLFAARQEWPTIARHVAAARSITLHQATHQRQINFYDGYIAIRTQQYDQGETLLQALLDQPDLEDTLQVRVLDTLAQSHMHQAHYGQALLFYQQVYTLASALDDREHQCIALLNMGIVHNKLGIYAQALDLSQRSLTLAQDLGDQEHAATALYGVGHNALLLGRWPLAQQHFDQAIELYGKLRVKLQMAWLHWYSGVLQHLRGDIAASEASYQQALGCWRDPEGEQPALALDTYAQLGLLYQSQGRWQEALQAYDRALGLASHMHNHYWLSMLPFRRGLVFKHQDRLADAQAAFKQAIDAIESLPTSTDGEEAKVALLGTAQHAYEAMVLLCLERGQHAEAFGYVERARARAFLDVLTQRAPHLHAAVDQPIAGLADVQARLPTSAMLIAYYTTGVLPREEHFLSQLPLTNPGLREHLAAPPQVLIFAITRRQIKLHLAELDPNNLRTPIDEAGPSHQLLRERLLVYLHERLIAPVAELIQGRSMVYIVPHGPLHYVPFTALHSAEGAHLLDRAGPALALVPSATMLVRTCMGRPQRQYEGVLALGYNHTSGSTLPYAEAEALHIGHRYSGQAWVGPAPKSPALLAAGAKVRWLHIAGHARFQPHDPLSSQLYLGDNDPLDARTIIGRLELHADLVTLSACTSGLSQIIANDTLQGLQRALLYAGAPAVICALWKVPDLVALLIMDQFYAALSQGQPSAAALRDAQVVLRTMTGRDLAALLARWQVEDPVLFAALSDLTLPFDHLDAPIYANPFYWAPLTAALRAIAAPQQAVLPRLNAVALPQRAGAAPA